MKKLGSSLDPVTEWRSHSIADEVRVRLQKAIMLGEFKPGDPLVQEDLCRQLNVSRQPVREALKQLESEGLVDVRQRSGGYRVRVYSELEVKENYELRKLLEGRTAHAAAGNLTPQDISELEKAIDDQLRAAERGDTHAVLHYNRIFHSLVWEIANKPLHMQLIRQLWSSVTVFTPMLLTDRAINSANEHQEILESLIAGHKAEAATRMRDHITRAAAQYARARRVEGDSDSTVESTIGASAPMRTTLAGESAWTESRGIRPTTEG